MGSPGEEKDITTREGKTPFESGRKMLPKKTFRTGSAKHSSSNLWDRDLITPDELLSLTPREKARYYNNTNMKLSYFAYKMHMTTKTITEDFKRNGYHYDEIDRKFKTVMQRHHDRMHSILSERKMQKLYLPFDD